MSAPGDRAVVAVRDDPHPAGNPLCPKCLIGFPLACVCGGWVHAGGPDGEPILACGRCGGEARTAEPFCVGGDAHAPGRPDCPACLPVGLTGGIAPCVCGGLIHQSTDGTRRCDRCGPRCEDLDV